MLVSDRLLRGRDTCGDVAETRAPDSHAQEQSDSPGSRAGSRGSPEQPGIDELIAELRQAAGIEQFDTAWRRGEAASVDDPLRCGHEIVAELERTTRHTRQVR